MKKLTIVLTAATVLCSAALFAEDTASAPAAQSAACTTAVQPAQDKDMSNCPMMNGKKGKCEKMAGMYANKAQMFKKKADKVAAKGDEKLAALLTNCSTTAQNVADQLNAMMKLKEQCMANSSCTDKMKKGGCSMSKQASDTSASAPSATDDKAAAAIQNQMTQQCQSVKSAKDSFEKAQQDLRAYMKTQKQAKQAAKDSKDQDKN